MADKLKLLAAALIVAGAIVGFYVFADQALFVRVLGVLVAAGIAVAITLRTEPGANTWRFGQGALIEIRKVVWPSRKETTQTTLIVMAMVFIVGIILWVFDMFLAWAIQLLTGQGG
ncbi:preprotein translocase subunit SecE [Thiohalomonas denitrificans]|uniref:preprotein translocase subunit SecE n=1 Tax=Thiohalomonas denitrificans TaxID=415747 RepID=UPI0026EE9A68|nr:preprotein translocase subunit SecE [Thiohalomonas denitrificans]